MSKMILSIFLLAGIHSYSNTLHYCQLFSVGALSSPTKIFYAVNKGELN